MHVCVRERETETETERERETEAETGRERERSVAKFQIEAIDANFCKMAFLNFSSKQNS